MSLSLIMSQFDTLYTMYPQHIVNIDQGDLSTHAHWVLK